MDRRLCAFGLLLAWAGLPMPADGQYVVGGEDPDSPERLNPGYVDWHPAGAERRGLVPEAAVEVPTAEKTYREAETGEYSRERESEEAAPPNGEEPVLDLGGVLRFNYLFMDWEGQEDNRNRWGEVRFDTFRLNILGSYRNLFVASEYRFYAGYHMLKHGYVGYHLNDLLELHAGLTQVPFGLTPYASNNWFFQLPYYLGLEDSHAAGLTLQYQSGPVSWQLGGFFNDGGSYTGSSISSARYSYDVVHTDADELGYADSERAPLDFDQDPLGRRQNSMSNQLNARGTWQFRLGGMDLETGASVQTSRLYNSATQRNGYHWAAALHSELSYGNWTLMLQGLRYVYSPENPEGQNDEIIVMGAYDAPYKVASRAGVVQAGLSYRMPVRWGPVSEIMFYNDYSRMLKDQAGFADSEQNVLGMLITAGQMFTYVDLAAGRNHAWFGPDYGGAFAEGTPGSGWNLRFNINVGYYF